MKSASLCLKRCLISIPSGHKSQNRLVPVKFHLFRFAFTAFVSMCLTGDKDRTAATKLESSTKGKGTALSLIGLHKGSLRPGMACVMACRLTLLSRCSPIGVSPLQATHSIGR
jgi:hypothetical protein